MPTYKDVDYALVRSGRRKTVSIFVERDGSVTVRVPEHLPEAEIEQILESKRAWIYKHLAEWRDLNATQVQREYVGGETFFYLGRRYRLKWWTSRRSPSCCAAAIFSCAATPRRRQPRLKLSKPGTSHAAVSGSLGVCFTTLLDLALTFARCG